MKLLKGADAAKMLTERAKTIAESLETPPKLLIVRFGADGSDLAYENNAKKRMEKCGILCESLVFPTDVEPALFFERFLAVNEDDSVDGILILQPLPAGIDGKKLFSMLKPEKDMDCASPVNRENLFEGKETVFPCTPEAVLQMLDCAGIELQGKHAVVIGRSMVVGKPLSMMLLQRNATVTICHSRTQNLREIARTADILIAAVGRPEMIDGSYVKDGAIVLDVGININAEGRLVGDCAPASMGQAALVSPVPGGVGSVTTSVLALHTAEAAKRKRG